MAAGFSSTRDLLPGNIPQGGRRELRPAYRQRREQRQAAGSAGGDCGESAALAVHTRCPGLLLHPISRGGDPFARPRRKPRGGGRRRPDAEVEPFRPLALYGRKARHIPRENRPERRGRRPRPRTGQLPGLGASVRGLHPLAQRESIHRAPRGPPPPGQAMVLRRPAACRKRPLRRGPAMLSPLVLLAELEPGAAPHCLPLLHRRRNRPLPARDQPPRSVSPGIAGIATRPHGKHPDLAARPGRRSGSSSQPGRSAEAAELPNGSSASTYKPCSP